MEDRVSKFDIIFGELYGDKSAEDMVMEQLELSENAKITSSEIEKAIIEAARLNLKTVDPKNLSHLIDTLGAEEQHRDEIRAKLSETADVRDALFYSVTA